MSTKIFVIGIRPSSVFCGNRFHRPSVKCDDSRLDELENELKALKERVNDLELEQEYEDERDAVFNEAFEPENDEPRGDMRFGAAFAIDEPRARDYDSEEDFLEAREAFDDFVDSGERCVDLGLERPEWAEEHRCNAIRKKVGEMPPIGVDLLGETEWWDEDVCDRDCWWL